VPFISKAIGVSLAKVASKAMIGKSLKEQNFSSNLPKGLSFVKEAVMPFDKFPHVDPILGPEMKSTGEVMGIGPNFGEAYAKAQKGANKILRKSGIVFVSVKKSDRKYLDDFAPAIIKCGFDIVATRGSARYIEALGYKVKKINKVNEGRPHVVDSILNNEIDLVINTTEGTQSIKDSASIRQSALRNKIFCTTTMFGASAVIEALQNSEDKWTYNTLQEINKL
jgi:carbamoyl-phosphate synthase large subunit